jgi:PRTRC genetic system protein B
MPSEFKNITDAFRQWYMPKKALIMYEHVQNNNEIYLESHDCSKTGKLINAHPLSDREIESLAEVIHVQRRNKEQYLQCDGLLPENLLYLNVAKKCVLWFTPAQTIKLYFTNSLHICNAEFTLPALVWKATDRDLWLYALTADKKPAADTRLYHAPVFNIHEDGKICMGTVEIEVENCSSLNQFISTWQANFFNSRFSHTIGNLQITRTPLEQLYRKLANSERSFPLKELKTTGKTLKNILP